ncbi:MAG: acyltransferase family protein [Gemmatirosa sp.]
MTAPPTPDRRFAAAHAPPLPVADAPAEAAPPRTARVPDPVPPARPETAPSPASTPSRGFRGHIREFDGLRGLGLIAVLVEHFAPRAVYGTPYYQFKFTGWIWLESFFVLSGFLIAGILLDARHEPRFFRNFFIRRSLRVFPLYYAVLLVGTASLLLLDDGAGYRALVDGWGSPGWFFAYVGNVRTAWLGAWPTAHFLVPLWSLQVEEQFYLLLPLAVWFLTPRTLFRVLLAAAIVSPFVRLALFLMDRENAHLQYVLLPSRFEGLAFGAMIALRYRAGEWHLPRARLLAVTGASLLAMYACLQWGYFKIGNYRLLLVGFTVVAVAFACVIICLIQYRDSRWTAWLRLPPLLYLGKVSYGVYLLQVPTHDLLVAITTHFGWPFPTDGWWAKEWWVFGVQVAATVALASVSWYAFEQPILRLKDRFAPTRKRGAVAPEPSPLLPEEVERLAARKRRGRRRPMRVA